MPACSKCGAQLRLEAAIAICHACGRLLDLADVTAWDQRLQDRIDRALRPRSAECISAW